MSLKKVKLILYKYAPTPRNMTL